MVFVAAFQKGVRNGQYWAAFPCGEKHVFELRLEKSTSLFPEKLRKTTEAGIILICKDFT